jgi:hypothetical protein
MFTKPSMKASEVSHQPERLVDLGGFKVAVAKLLSSDHPLAKLMSVEEDHLGAHEFLAKMRTWLKLLQIN